MKYTKRENIIELVAKIDKKCINTSLRNNRNLTFMKACDFQRYNEHIYTHILSINFIMKNERDEAVEMTICQNGYQS